MAKERLQKIIAQSGIASRRKSEELIKQGKVLVNGRKAEIGDKADAQTDIIVVDGKKIADPEKLRYIILHKPRGYVTTMSDEFDRKCVADLINGIDERVFSVGRLDRDSEGLLLLTNDGELSNALSHPSSEVPKVYRVTLRAMPTYPQMQDFKNGMYISGDIRKTAPASIRVLVDESNENTLKGRVVVEVVIREGRNRQIRRMFEKFGVEVARLRRTFIGDIRLGMLQAGKWRELEQEEVDSLFHTAGIVRTDKKETTR